MFPIGVGYEIKPTNGHFMLGVKRGESKREATNLKEVREKKGLVLPGSVLSFHFRCGKDHLGLFVARQSSFKWWLSMSNGGTEPLKKLKESHKHWLSIGHLRSPGYLTIIKGPL